MAFLDNSGDIILDAVLTDTGRLRLAKGDGSFRITQFAFADDEINYGLYNKNHPSGSAYYDLEILQTPVLEAFTNNTSVLKYQLISNNRTDLLFLPLVKANTRISPFPTGYSSYFVTANSTTTTAANNQDGFLDGVTSATSLFKSIVLDQGLDSEQTDRTKNLIEIDPTLYESQYLVEVNYNLVRLKLGNQLLEPSSIDDDGYATYVLDQNINSNSIETLDPSDPNISDTSYPCSTVLNGTRGSRLTFNLQVSTQVQIGTEIFTRLGGTFNASSLGLSASTYYIDTAVTIRGLTTGVSTTVPLKIVKNS